MDVGAQAGDSRPTHAPPVEGVELGRELDFVGEN